MKSLLVLLVALLVGVGFWLLREPAQLARLMNSAQEGAKQMVAPAVTSVSSVTSPAAGLRKCKRGGEVLYTNDKCPAGSQEEAVKGGSLTVLPAAPAVAAPNPSASEPSIQEKRIDKIIGQ
jgi:hypothetical protein